MSNTERINLEKDYPVGSIWYNNLRKDFLHRITGYKGDTILWDGYLDKQGWKQRKPIVLSYFTKHCTRITNLITSTEPLPLPPGKYRAVNTVPRLCPIIHVDNKGRRQWINCDGKVEFDWNTPVEDWGQIRRGRGPFIRLEDSGEPQVNKSIEDILPPQVCPGCQQEKCMGGYQLCATMIKEEVIIEETIKTDKYYKEQQADEIKKIHEEWRRTSGTGTIMTGYRSIGCKLQGRK